MIYCPVFASNVTESSVGTNNPGVSEDGIIKVDYLQAPLNNNQPQMGLMGIHYEENLIPVDNFYTGLGFYGAVSGNTGGYFALGVDNDYFWHLNNYFAINPGLFAGGGGGRGAGFGGGLVVIPHIGLDWNFLDTSQLGLNYSYVSFPNSNLGSSSELMLSYIYSFKDYHVPFDTVAKNLNTSDTKYTSSNLFLEPLLAVYRPTNPVSLNNQTISNTIALPGAEIGYQFKNGIYSFIKANGAANGGISGYMDVFVGAGDKIQLNNTFAYLIELGTGSGGGGNVDTGGGWLVNPATGLEVNLNDNWAIDGTVGYLIAPETSFQSMTYNLGIKYGFNNFTPDFGGDNYTDIDLSKWRINVFNQTLTNSSGVSGYDGTINSVAFSFDQYFNDNFYLDYGASSAYAGQNSGGMAIGNIGPGFQMNFSILHPYFLIPIGVIGGGGVKEGNGVIIEPTVGSYIDFTQYFSLNLGAGIMRSLNTGDALETPFINAGISYRFAKLSN